MALRLFDRNRFGQISRLVDVFMSLGVNHVRLTGGEPLLRRDLPVLVDMIAGKEGLNDLALTSNGILLAAQIDELPPLLRFGSWIGGDRDGHPFVTAEVTAEVTAPAPQPLRESQPMRAERPTALHIAHAYI